MRGSASGSPPDSNAYTPLPAKLPAKHTEPLLSELEEHELSEGPDLDLVFAPPPPVPVWTTPLIDFWSLLSLISFVLIPLLSGGVLLQHFWVVPLKLNENIMFKVGISAITLSSALLYVLAHWACQPYNDDGAAVALGNDKCGHLFYCGNEFPLPGSDGRCGPNNGPQCDSCLRFQQRAADRGLTPKMVRYMQAARRLLEVPRWLAPTLSFGVFFLISGAPGEDLTCGPRSWSPMVPPVASLYLPARGSWEDNRTTAEFLRLTAFLPFAERPGLLLPTMDEAITTGDREERNPYFMLEIVALVSGTCLVLEAARWLCKNCWCSTAPDGLGAQLQGQIARADSAQLAASRFYLGVFSLWYIGYQMLLYVIMDFGVAHGGVSMDTGIAWELWIPFVQFLMVTALFTGVPWYVYNCGISYESPTPLILLQLLPWLGNEIHIMKDHIAQALCFAAAHCSTGSLRQVGLLLGYLSFAATAFPLYFLFSDTAAFRGLRASHWPILESDAVNSSMSSKTLREKAGQKMNQTMIAACTKDKYLRALAGEVPHAILHALFAYFFGDGLFILSAIVLSGAKISFIPGGRLYLQTSIPKLGCSEAALGRFFRSVSPRLNWSNEEEAIAKAFEYEWTTTLELLRAYAPNLNKIFRAEGVAGAQSPVAPTDDGEEEEDEEQAGGGQSRFGRLLLDAVDSAEGSEDRAVENYLGVLQVLHHRLGVHGRKQTALTVEMVCAGCLPVAAMHHFQEIVAMGGTPDIDEFSQWCLRESELEDEDKAIVQGAVARVKQASVVGYAGSKSKLEDGDVEDGDEATDHTRHVAIASAALMVAVPLLFWGSLQCVGALMGA